MTIGEFMIDFKLSKLTQMKIQEFMIDIKWLNLTQKLPMRKFLIDFKWSNLTYKKLQIQEFMTDDYEQSNLK